jgi:UDP-glucuronate 4-epimerase
MILVTGAAGFIGFHSSKQLLSDGHEIIGIDNMNEYYDPTLKKNRLKILQKNKRFLFSNADICNYSTIEDLFKKHKIKKICHLAAQAGVRYSLSHPHVYQKSNGEGFLNILELARYSKIENFVYASSSQFTEPIVKLPFLNQTRRTSDLHLRSDKKIERIGCSQLFHLFGIPCSGLRFFTVYGPWEDLIWHCSFLHGL